jgi:hypothetical protein
VASGTRQPLGPPPIDFRLLSDEDFEELCVLVILMEHSEAKRIRPPDGGADAVLASATALVGRFERCWQVKHFTGQINWGQCEESLDRGCGTYRPSHYTFMFARDLTLPQHRAFTERLETRQPDVKVDYVGATGIVTSLLSSAQGERIASRFYADANVNGAALMAALRAAAAAGGPLETADDVASRLTAIAEFLDRQDPYFAYSPSARPRWAPPPVVPGSVLARETLLGENVERIDVLPRNTDALEQFAPEMQIVFEESARGRAAAEELESVLLHGGDLQLPAGAWAEFTRLPKLFESDLGGRLEAVRIMVPQEVIPARLMIRTESRSISRDIELVRRRPREGWEACMVASLRGAELEIALRRKKSGGGQVRFDWKLVPEASNKARLDALDATIAIAQLGTLVIEGRGDGVELFRQGLKKRRLPAWVTSLQTVLAAVVDIEEWSGNAVTVPEELTREDLQDLAEVAYIVRSRGSKMRFASVDLSIPPEKVAWDYERYRLRIEQPAQFKLFGEVIDLGFLVGELEAVATVGAPDTDGILPVRLEPAAPEFAEPRFELTRTAATSDL